MTKNNKYNSISNWWIISLFSIGIILTMAMGVTLAWLTDIVNRQGQTTIGQVGIEIYSGDTKLNGTIQGDGSYIAGYPLEVALGNLNVAKSVNLSVKNTGNIPGIVRCFVAISTEYGPYDHFTDLDGAKFLVSDTQMSVVHNDWVVLYDSPVLEGTYYYNLFFNNQLSGGQSANIITSVTPLEDGINNTNIFIYVRAEIVAYSGNAYQVDSVTSPVQDIDKPFGVLTSEFLEVWTAWQ